MKVEDVELCSLDELTGRTIVGAAETFGGTSIMLLLDNEKVAYFTIGYDHGDDEGFVIVDHAAHIDDRNLFELGLISKEEYKRRYEEKEEAYRQRIEAADYNDFLRLKMKFEPDD